ncbi:MAG: 50S ribosomal protein L29 [Candidatus Paceibacterota bacterium]
MKELIKKTVAELQKLLEEKRKALSDFKFQIAGSKIKNVREGRKIKKEIAQILTAQKEVK